MTDSDSGKTNAQPKRSSLGRKLMLAAAAFVVLLVTSYFVATSSPFLRSFVLPRVAKAIGADVAAAEISLSPFSQIVLQKLRVQTAGSEPLLTADEAKVRYDLSAILHGNIVLHEVSLAAPAVQISIDANGKSNLDPLLKKSGAPPAQPAKSAGPVRLDVKNVSLKNGKVRLVTQSKDGSAQTIELENLNLGLDQVRNGGSGKMNLSSDVKFEQRAASAKGATTDRAQAKLNGDLDVGLDAQLMPSAIKGSVRVDFPRAEGAFRDLAGLSAALQADATLSEIRELALRLERGGKGLGVISASGPFNVEKRETRLDLQIQSIDRQVLNLFGATRGWDFGDSVLNATNTVAVTQKGSVVAASGALTGNNVGIRQASGATPPVDLSLNYQVNVNLAQKTAMVEKLDLAVQENQKQLLQASLDRAMSLNWGTAAASIPDSTFQLALQDFNLQAWQALLSTNVPNGRVNLRLAIQAQQDGKKLSTKLAGDVQDLAARVGTNQIDRAQARFELSGKVQDMKVVDLDQYRIELLLKGQTVASDSGTLHCDWATKDVSVKTDLEVSLPELLKPFPVPQLTASSGRIKGGTTFSQNSRHRTASGQLQLADFTGQIGPYDLQDFQTAVDYSVDIGQDLADVQRAKVTFGQGGQSGGSADISGRFHLTNHAAQIAFKLADLNQRLLRPFLRSALGEAQLVSISLSGQGSAGYDPTGESGVKADFAIANWAMKDPSAKFPVAPVSGRIQIDGSLRQEDLDVRQLAVDLQQGASTPSHLDLKGRFHLANKTGQATFNVAQVDQTVLAPWVGPLLGKARLVSVSVNGQGAASYDPKGESAVKGEVKVSNFAMDDPQNRFPKAPMDVRLQVDGALRQPEIDIRGLVLDINQGPAGAGHVDVQGKFNLTNYSGAGTFKISDFDQTVLRPLLAPSLGENNLVSIALNGSGSASFDPKGDAIVKAEVKVANLVVEDAKKTLARTPLSAQIQMDSSVRKQVVELRQFALKLSPTDRAQNQLQLQGHLDLSPTNATPSQLALQADSLDLTPYYDLFGGTAGTNRPAPPSAAAPAGEPGPIPLPMQDFTADVKVNRCFLRDLAVTNLQATAKINRGEITLKPLQFAVNGAPVNASAVLNLGVPGYKYDVALKADQVPLGPFASSFSRDAAGRVQGVLLADAQIKGAGVTGANLQKNLNGQVWLSLTNLNLEVVGKKTRALLEPIALLLRVPELTLTPLEWVNAKADLGQGRVNLGQFSVFSQAFSADGRGTVQIAPVLTNSALDIPVTISVRRALAQKANLIPPGTPADAAYVRLPSFAKLSGTLGNPKTETDKLVISGLLLQSAGNIPQVGGKTGSVLQGLGGVLTGQNPLPVNTNIASATNALKALQTNRPPAKLNPLDLFNLIPRKK